LDAKEQRRLSQPFAATTPWPQARRFRRLPQAAVDVLIPAAATMLLFVGVLVIAALNEHPVLRVHPSPTATFVRSLVPLAVASVVVLAAYRPWPGFLAVLALTPIWNSAQVQIQLGPLQIILQTVFVIALLGGCAIEKRNLRRRARRATGTLVPPSGTGNRSEGDLPATPFATPAIPSATPAVRSRRGFEAIRFVEVATVFLLLLAVASTLASPNVANSIPGLLHGVAEPIAMGAILVWLRPSPKGLVMVAVALATSIALGSLIDVLQAIKAYGTLSSIVSHRLLFTEVTYDNVGLFGVIVATVIPLVSAVLLLWRNLGIPRWAVGFLVVAMVLALAGLFFSVSKSAWLATAVAMTLLALLLMRSWWKRVATSLAVVALSAVFIPWPAFLLQVAPPVDTAYRTAVIAMVGQSRFDSWNPTTLSGHGSMAERYYAIEGGLHMAVDHPFLGVGLDEFHTYYMQLGYRPAAARDDLDHAHSVFPEVAAELGLPALAMLLTIFGAALWAMWRTYRAAADKVTRTLAATLIVSIAAWVIAATAYGADIYRPFRDQASDTVAIAVVLAMAVALARSSSDAVRRRLPGAAAAI
jgi:O-antigen ligase